MPGREIDDVDSLELCDRREHRMPRAGKLEDLRAREGTTHQRGRHTRASLIVQHDRIAQDGGGLRHGLHAELLEVRVAQTVHAGLVGELVEGRQRQLDDILREIGLGQGLATCAILLVCATG